MADKKKNHKQSVRLGTRDRVQKLLGDIEARLEAETGKASVADYIRLLQLERELEENEPPREIKVTWVEKKSPQPYAEK